MIVLLMLAIIDLILLLYSDLKYSKEAVQDCKPSIELHAIVMVLLLV